MILYIVKIVLKLFLRVFNCGTVFVLDLGPARHPRLDAVSYCVVGDLLGELLHKVRSLRARSHKTHLTTQHVEQLWQLINSKASNDTANARHAGILSQCPNGLAVLFSADQAACRCESYSIANWPVCAYLT